MVYEKHRKTLGGEQPRNYTQKQNSPTINMRDPPTCGSQMTADYTGLPMLAQHMHCAGAQTKATKCMGAQTPVGCTGTSAS